MAFNSLYWRWGGEWWECQAILCSHTWECKCLPNRKVWYGWLRILTDYKLLFNHGNSPVKLLISPTSFYCIHQKKTTFQVSSICGEEHVACSFTTVTWVFSPEYFSFCAPLSQLQELISFPAGFNCSVSIWVDGQIKQKKNAFQQQPELHMIRSNMKNVFTPELPLPQHSTWTLIPPSYIPPLILE